MVTGPTGGWLFVKPPQSVEEATYAVTPTSSPTFSFINPVYDLTPTFDPDIQDIWTLGHEDATTFTTGLYAAGFTMSSYVNSSTFLKYGVSAQGGGSGTIDKSLSIFWSQLVSGTETFHILSGCRINSIKFKGTPGKPLMVDYEIIGSNLTVTTTNPLSTPTYATDPGVTPWNFDDGGSSNITIGGSPYDVTQIEVDIARNLEKIYTMNQNNISYLPAKNRKVTGTITTLYENATNVTALEALTNQALVWTLKTATSVLTLNNMTFRKLTSIESKPDAITYARYAFESIGTTSATNSATIT